MPFLPHDIRYIRIGERPRPDRFPSLRSTSRRVSSKYRVVHDENVYLQTVDDKESHATECVESSRGIETMREEIPSDRNAGTVFAEFANNGAVPYIPNASRLGFSRESRRRYEIRCMIGNRERTLQADGSRLHA